MPELPEVETVRMKLLPRLINRVIKEVKPIYSKYDLLKEIKNQTVNDIKRKGKFLIFYLDNYIMISHLRMEGKYFIKEKNIELTKHDLLVFEFDEFNLIYNDVRKFGVFYLFDKNVDIYKTEPLINVGEEPFTIKKEDLYQKLRNKKEPIKVCLLDQSIISGLGNIYVDEVLYYSKINPFRRGMDITLSEAEKIINNSIEILNNSIKAGGSTIKSFESFNGEIGHFQGFLKCHNRENERCERCGNIIIKTRCGGRGTYYCPTCEKLDKDKKIYAITGTFSSGKSTSLKIIKDLGFSTFSCDEIYNSIFNESKEMMRELKNRLKVSTKEEIRDKCFNNKENNKILMDITHKYVIKELFKKIDSVNEKNVFVEVPLLFEGGFENSFDKVIDIYEGDEVRDKLLKAKGYTKEEALKRYGSQLSREEKKKRSDYIIINDGSIDELKIKIINLLKEMGVY